MKTLYKKLLIIGVASLVLEAIIIYFLFTSINAFYADLTNKIAFLLTEQVQNVIIPENFDMSKFSQYNKYPARRLMKRFSREDSEILHILLIDKDYKIVVSDEPTLEGQQYTNQEELELLTTQAPQILNRNWAGNVEILDVILPLWQNGQKQGYLRTVISVKHLQNFSRNRQTILIFASIISFLIIILTVFLTSRIYQSSIREINAAIENLSDSRIDVEPPVKGGDELSSTSSRVHRLVERTAVLSDSFQQSEDRIRAMMRVIHEGLLIIDGDMNILTYNEYLLDILQVKKYTDSEKNIYQILQKNPKLLEVYRRAKDPMTHAIRKVLSLRLLNGKSVNVQVIAMPIAGQKEVGSIILYIKNLGVLQELERNLHRSMKYGVISQLASSVGHEIRNPLSSLSIHTGIVDNLVSKSVSDETQLKKIKKSVGILNSEVERLNKMIDQFFNLARAQELELTYENINALMNEVLELVQQQAFEKNIHIHKDFSDNLPMLYISKDQIKQVIINLILNAYDAMPEGGDLHLGTRYGDGNVIITVEDSGKGIDEEIRDHIFDLYFSTKKSGGGIGLAVSRKIIEVHEGKIYFDSKDGRGTVFSIELPTS